MTKPWRGRIEDAALLRGAGHYADDRPLPGQAVACFVRSPHAFAQILEVDTAAAAVAPGVLAVLTAADMEAAGIGNLSRPVPQVERDGTPIRVVPRPALAGERVRHVGEPVAVVIAESGAAAQDAAELVEVDYRPLPAVDLNAATGDGASRLDPAVPGNIALEWTLGAVDKSIYEPRTVPHLVDIRVVNQPIAVASLEPRGATATHDPVSDAYTLRCGSQGVTILRDQLAGILGVPPERLRVTTEDVGGGFGMKSGPYPEYVAILVAAKRLGRPVHWMSTRSEAFLSDQLARDTVTYAALALDADGRFLALDVEVAAGMGAYITNVGAFIATSNFARCLSSVYRVPAIAAEISCVYTNSVPTGPYRGAGRPEANYVIERLIDKAAHVTGIDRIELRRRNLVTPAQMPYKTPIGVTYDSGDFPAIFEEALQRADVAGFAARRARAEAAGKRRGLGISCFLEHAGGPPVEGAALAFPGGEKVALDIATGATGQGHATIFRRLVAERLGLDEAQVMVRAGDTALGVVGSGTIASRNTMTTGTASLRAVEALIEKGLRQAARLLEAAEADVEYSAGSFRIRGTDRELSLFEVAEKAKDAGEPLDSTVRAEVPQSFPNGCHVCEVEIDPETGALEIIAYVAVDDCGVALDPVLVEGQVQGGVAQGIGQALMEDFVYSFGQPLAGSFIDYAMPRADNVPNVQGTLHPVPCRTNPLGVKGTGEAGTTAALAAVMNAICDAIPGVKIDMPATPEKLCRACNPLSFPPDPLLPDIPE